jgi:hypothetical protein
MLQVPICVRNAIPLIIPLTLPLNHDLWHCKKPDTVVPEEVRDDLTLAAPGAK